VDVAELAAAYTGMLETELGVSLTSLFVQLLRRDEVRGELFTADPSTSGSSSCGRTSSTSSADSAS